MWLCDVLSVHLYADDTQLYLPFPLTPRGAERAVIQIEDCIDDVRKWMSINKLKLNEDKTELLVSLPSRQAHKCSITSITIGGCEVQKTDSARNLGVIFDCF